jgi:hypothetical protein
VVPCTRCGQKNRTKKATAKITNMGIRKQAMIRAHSHNDAGGAIGILVAFGLVAMGSILSIGLVMPLATRLLGFEPSVTSGSETAVISAALSTVVVALAAFRPSRMMQNERPDSGTTVTTNTPALTTTTTTASSVTLSAPPLGPTIEIDASMSLEDGTPIVVYFDTSDPSSMGSVVGWMNPYTGVYTQGDLPSGTA